MGDVLSADEVLELRAAAQELLDLRWAVRRRSIGKRTSPAVYEAERAVQQAEARLRALIGDGDG